MILIQRVGRPYSAACDIPAAAWFNVAVCRTPRGALRRYRDEQRHAVPTQGSWQDHVRIVADGVVIHPDTLRGAIKRRHSILDEMRLAGEVSRELTAQSAREDREHEECGR